MALALNAFSFSVSTFRFRCRHFLNTPEKKKQYCSYDTEREDSFRVQESFETKPVTLWKLI